MLRLVATALCVGGGVEAGYVRGWGLVGGFAAVGGVGGGVGGGGGGGGGGVVGGLVTIVFLWSVI